MAKFTKIQRQQIEKILYDVGRARFYIGQPDIAIGKLGEHATTTTHFVRTSDGKAFYPLAKDIGSDLCGLDFAFHALVELLFQDSQIGK